MADEPAQLVAEAFDRAIIAAWFAEPGDVAPLALLALEQILASGLTRFSAQVVGILAIVANRSGDLALGLALDDAAVKVERRTAVGVRGLVTAYFHGLVWHRSRAECDRNLAEAFDTAQSAGDFQFASYAAFGRYLAAFPDTDDCAELIAALDRTTEHAHRFAPTTAGYSVALRHLTDRLHRDRPDPVDVDAILTTYAEAGDEGGGLAQTLGVVVLHEAMLGDYAAATRHHHWAKPMFDAGAGGAGACLLAYYVGSAVAGAQLARAAADDEIPAAWLGQVRDADEQLCAYAALPAPKFAGYFHLVAAEHLAALGETEDALHEYRRAIDAAAGRGQTLLEVWANELLGRFHLHQGRRLGNAWLREARRLYDRCGAGGKVAQIDREFPEITAAVASGPDLAAILTTCQQMAAETVRHRVMETFLDAAVAATGADDGEFVSPNCAAPAADNAQSLVFPLERGGTHLGTLVLHAATQFGPGARVTLELLAGQAAISLENAALYADLEAQVNARRAELSATMEELQLMQDQIVASEKLAALGGLVAGVAHEINNPVGIAVTAASHLVDATTEFGKQYAAGPLRRSTLDTFTTVATDSAQTILTNLRRAADLVAGFKQVAVDQAGEARREFAVGPYLHDVLASLGPRLRGSKHILDLDAPTDLSLTSYPGALAQVTTNLVLNSLLHAYPDGRGGRMHFTVTRTGAGARIVYTDDGNGIPDDVLPRVFEPFFTTRRDSGCTGLGLHIVHNLVTGRLGGQIAVRSEPGVGTEFTIDLTDQPEAGDG
jgi:signal transduction histidine kinase